MQAPISDSSKKLGVSGSSEKKKRVRRAKKSRGALFPDMAWTNAFFDLQVSPT